MPDAARHNPEKAPKILRNRPQWTALKRFVARMDKESDNAAPISPRIAFGDYVLDTDRGVLSRAGDDVTLRPKSLGVLRVLLANAGRLVTKDQLMEAVWPGAVVGDDTLTQSIGDIRRALGEDGQRLLQTLPRRGYLLDVDVTAAKPVDAESRRRGEQPAGLHRLTIAGALLVASLVVLVMLRDESPVDPVSEVSVTAARPVIVVPKFADETDRAELGYLAKGLWRDVVAELKRSSVVIALEPETIAGWDGKPGIAAIAERTSSDYVLTGVVDEQANVLRFRFTLYDASAQAPVWRHEISQANLDALAVRQALLAELDEPFLAKPPNALAIAGPPSSEAYDHYLRGKMLLDGLSPDDEDAAHYHLKSATQIAPDFAPAWRELARAQYRLFDRRDGGYTPDDVRLLYSLMQRASVLAPTDAATQAYLAWHEIDFNGSFANGFERLATALELNPYDEDVLRVAMHTAYASGDAAAAVSFARYSQRFNPLCKACRYHKMQALMAQHDFSGALAAFDEWATLFQGGHTTKARMHLLAGDPETALAEIEREALAVHRISTKVMVLQALGRRDEAAALLDEFVASAPDNYYLRSRLYAYLGDNDQSFAMLDALVDSLRSVSDGEIVRWNNTFIGGWVRNPEFQALHGDPRWADFLGRHRLHPPDGALQRIIESLPGREPVSVTQSRRDAAPTQ